MKEIYISGEMPKSCYDCAFEMCYSCKFSGGFTEHCGEKERLPNCPLCSLDELVAEKDAEIERLKNIMSEEKHYEAYTCRPFGYGDDYISVINGLQKALIDEQKARRVLEIALNTTVRKMFYPQIGTMTHDTFESCIAAYIDNAKEQAKKELEVELSRED